MKKIATLYRLLLISFLLCIFSFKSVSSNYFWIGNSGNWSELNHWATTSGGSTLHTQIPTALDDVFFDANSFTLPGQAVNFDPLTILAHHINWTGVTNSPTWIGSNTNSLRLYGSLTLVPGMTMNFGGPVLFEATTTGQTIVSAGKIFLNEVAFDGIGGGWTLQDAFTSNNIIRLNAGTFTTNNQIVSASQFWSLTNTTRVLNMGSSVFNFSGYTAWWILNPGCTINCGTSVINFTGINAQLQGNTTSTDTYYDINFTGSGQEIITGASNFHDVVFSGAGNISNTGSFHNVSFHANGEIDASNVFNDLTFTAGFKYLLGMSFTQTINGTFTAAGSCNAPITIFSNAQGFTSTISHPPSTVNVHFVTLRDIHAIGGANFLATNSTDLTNNTGWTFVPASIQNLYWIGNGGDWDDGNHWSHTSGGAPSGCAPTLLDNVLFDANSFSSPAQIVLINVLEANCRNMDWTGVTNTPTLATDTILNNLNIFGSLKFVPGMNLTHDGRVDFESSSSGETITTSGKVFLNETRFNGANGEWILQDTFNSDSSVILNAGRLNTNNQTVNADDFTSGSFFPRALNMGSSVFNLHEVHGWTISGGNLIFNSGSSVINLTSADAQLVNSTQDIPTYYNVNFTGLIDGSILGTAYFHDVVFSAKGIILDSCRFHTATFQKDGDIFSNNVYDDLHFSAGGTYRLLQDHTQTINGTFSALGNCESLITITCNNSDSNTYIHPLSGPVNIAHAVLRDIHVTGPGGSTASSSINLGNNTGWTFTAPAANNLYWIGNAGNWTDGNHWSLSSGGPASGCAPTPLDNVFFDANSFTLPAQSVSVNITTAYCRNMNWTGSLHNPDFEGPQLIDLKIYGSLTFITGMSMNYQGMVDFEATTAGQTITSGISGFIGTISFNGTGGEWTLLNKLATASTISLNHGTLNTNNQSVNGFALFSLFNTTRVLNMGSSIFNMSGALAWDIENPGITINCGTSVINCTNANGANFKSNSGGTDTYYNLNFSPEGAINGTCNFHDVVFNNKGTIRNSCSFHQADFHANGDIFSDNVYDYLHFTAGFTYKLWKNSTQTINTTFDASGTCGSLITINSDTPDSTATISHPPGTVNVSYNILRDIHAIGGAAFTASASLDLGNNTGWTFSGTGAPDLYWVGNTGDWNSGNHWSLTSGGVPSGCVPTLLNNVFFDANSFSTGGQTVTINVLMAYCKSMNWTGVGNGPAFASTDFLNQLNIYGSLKFDAAMNMSFDGKVNFEATTSGQTIYMSGNVFNNDVAFNGTGQWTLQDVFTTYNTILFNSGVLHTNGQLVTAVGFLSSTNATRTLDMGSSVFSMYGANAWNIQNSGLTINCGTSLINCISSIASFIDICIPAHTYYDVNFIGNSSNNIFGTNHYHNVNFAGSAYIFKPNTFNDVSFHADGQIDSNNVFHDLNFTGGQSYILGQGSTQTVNNRWQIQGTCTEYILLQTSNAGFFATVSCAADSVFGHNIHIRDIHCTGAAAFMAYNSVDLGGNAGWNFTVLPPLSNIGSINGPTTICAGSTSITYTVTPVQGAINYQWTVPPGATITSGQGTHTITVDFNTVVSGSITVQACGGCGCSNTSTSSPIVVGAGTTPILTLTSNAGNNICMGTTVNFSATATNTGSATVVYDFQLNNTSVQTGNSNTYSTSALVDGDEIVCIITASSGGCFTTGSVSSNSITLNVSPSLTPEVSLAADPGSDICSGTMVTFTATATNTSTAAITYNFILNGTNVQSSNSNTYTSSTLADGDLVTCTITVSGNGCFTSNNAISNSITIHSASSFTPSLTIAASPGTTICLATPVTFTATATNTATATITYDFKINGTIIQSGNSNTYTSSTLVDGDVVTCIISLSGTTSCLTSTNALSNVITIHLTSSLSPSVTIAASPGTTVCLATPVTFTATATNTAIATITYDFKINGTIIQSGNSNTYTSSALADGDVITCAISLSGSVSCLTSTDALSNSITIHTTSSLTPSVTIAVNPGNTICFATAVTFTATATNTATATITYDFKINGITVQSSNSNLYSSSTLANGDIVTCIISLSTGPGNCFTSTEALSNALFINVTPTLSPSVSIVANPGTIICTSTPVTFTATTTNTGTAIINYDFKINGISVQSSNSNIYTTATLVNGDIITSTISLSTAPGNCFTSTNALSNSLTIQSNPPLSPSVTIAANPGNTVCPATIVVFTATASNTGTGTINYDFEVNGTGVQNSSSNVYSSTVSNGDMITCVISLTGSVTCLTSVTAISNSITMSIDANSGNVQVNAGTNVTISAGETVQLNGIGDAGTYLWSPSTGLSATNILNPIASPIVTTTYTLTITNDYGCSASDDVNVLVKDIINTGCTLEPRIAFTPNGDGINDKWIVWEGSCSISTSVTVIDRYGLLVFQSQQYQNDWQGTYKGKTLPDGTYYFTVEYKLPNGKIIKKRNNVTILR
ncbi:MAG: T9SS type B sorting domain-containing protein [Ferruginibacter sp.]